MGVKFRVEDGFGSEVCAAVSSRGELITSPIEYSSGFTVEANVIDTAFNFVGPQAGMRFVITDILLYANRDVGINDAEVVVYEATGAAVTTVSLTLLEVEMLKQSARDITGLRLLVSEGVWVNIKTNDNTIFGTIMGYYVQV